eukprot:TRINITY_DN5379_c3_g1_i1.p1 TRINITY_DN5379_c3_g1~~TRINITY_DN5379_c3_g1_i1.p1  ORF type:complete len:1012 (+),score=364.19 TRINITY_DN5379_c3_g1_i1:80-3037(+)
MSGEHRDRRRRDEGDRKEHRDRRRRDEEAKDRDRRRRDEGGDAERDRDRRRRDEGGDRDRRRRDEEPRRRDSDKGDRDRDRDRERRRRDEAAAEEASRPKEKEKGAVEEDKPKKVDLGRSFGLTYNAYKAGRRTLEKYDKKCSYDQILERGLNSSEFSTMIGRPGMPRDEAKALKEEAKQSETFRKKPDQKEESRRIMRDFYRTVFEWAGQQVPPELRTTVDEFEQRYKQEKKLEKERAEEKLRQEREAEKQEVEETAGGSGGAEEEEDDGYGDDFEPEAEDAAVRELAEKMKADNIRAMKSVKGAQHTRPASNRRSPHASQQAAQIPGGATAPTRSHEEMYRISVKRAMWEKQMRRVDQLLGLMDLEEVTLDLQGVEPMTEYDLYIRNFGTTNTAQASTQKPDQAELDHIEIQTDKIVFADSGAQVPEDLGLAGKSRPVGKQARKGQHQRVEIDAARLSRFLANCTPVFRVLLDEGDIRSTRSAASGSALAFSNEVTSLRYDRLVRGRGTVAVAFSRVAFRLHYLVTVHGPPTEPTDDPSSAYAYDGLCLVWNINNPTAPDKVLTAGGTLTTATFGAQGAHLLYAGSKDGTVYLWDLREPDYYHTNSIRSTGRQEKRGAVADVLRMPSYSTDHLAVHKDGTPTENHTCAVRRILPVGYNNVLGLSAEENASEQVATLDEIGNVSVWIVVDVHEAVGKRNFVSQTDFGLNIFSRVKLFKTATLHTINPTRDVPKCGPDADTSAPARPSTARARTPAAGGRRGRRQNEVAGYSLDIRELSGALPCVMASDLEFQPDDAAQFLVATDTGFINHGSRYKEFAVPANYRSLVPAAAGDPRELAKIAARPYDFRYGTKALAVHYSPVDSNTFLAAFADGSISIYQTGWPDPLQTFQDFTRAAIIQARWSPLAKSVIWLLDADGMMHVFDLMSKRPEHKFKPMLTADCVISTDDGKSFPNDFELSLDGRKMAISYDRGRVDLHVLKTDLSQ